MHYKITYFFDKEESEKRGISNYFTYHFSARNEEKARKKAVAHIKTISDRYKDPRIKVDINFTGGELKYRVIYRSPNKPDTKTLEFFVDEDLDNLDDKPEHLAFKKACRHLTTLLKKDHYWTIEEIALFSEQEQKYIPIIDNRDIIESTQKTD